MAGFPIFVEVGRRPPLIVGGGELALTKARLLLKRAQVVDVAANRICEGMRELSKAGTVRILPAELNAEIIRGRPLVVSATADEDEDRRISAIACAFGVPVNVPDRPLLSTFSLPSIVDRGTVTIAIGTEGAAPVLATRLRAWLEAELHPRIGRLADVARSYRHAVAKKVSSALLRRRFWERVFDGPAAGAILAGDESEGRAQIEAMLAQAGIANSSPTGRVTLVGAGPGAADLLTVRAVRALKAADVIVHDGLMGRAALDHARREARLISVAKTRGRHARTQAGINALLVAFAREGKNVVRLKGGDPSIFGRSGEEIDALGAAGIAFDIVPGITAASAAAASLRIPLTHRAIARSLVFISGHSAENEDCDFDQLDLSALGQSQVTLAVYMGLATAHRLAQTLIRAGWSPAMPVLAIGRVSQNDEDRMVTSLDALSDEAALKDLAGPALLIIGEVAGLAPVNRGAGAGDYRRNEHGEQAMNGGRAIGRPGLEVMHDAAMC